MIYGGIGRLKNLEVIGIEKANGNEKIRWLENLLFFCCIHRILMKNADSQTKMLKIRHSIREIISQIKKFVECFILRKHFYRKIRLIYYIIYCFLTVVKNLVKKKHNINSFF